MPFIPVLLHPMPQRVPILPGYPSENLWPADLSCIGMHCLRWTTGISWWSFLVLEGASNWIFLCCLVHFQSTCVKFYCSSQIGSFLRVGILSCSFSFRIYFKKRPYSTIMHVHNKKKKIREFIASKVKVPHKAAVPAITCPVNGSEYILPCFFCVCYKYILRFTNTRL